MVTSLWVAPRCIISLVSVLKLARHLGHFFFTRAAENSLQQNRK